ncbi:MAG TPA: FG-GAP-like repeat-containing protein [Kofleriaceae bacterium]|nr:FG-GAP-like repeat-containing protein [Kofleriaceae bacterium]
MTIDEGVDEEDMAITIDRGQRWPSTIRYLIDDDGQYAGKRDAHCDGASGFLPLPVGDAAMIRSALAEWSAVSPITFVEIQPGQEPDGSFLIYTTGTSANTSHATTHGMPKDGRPACVVLNSVSSIDARGVLHETGHELGMPHEQQRFDAPDHLFIDLSCVHDDLKGNYDLSLDDEVLTPFDFASIMEYPSSNFCDETLPGCLAPDGGCAHPTLLKKIPGCTATSRTDPNCLLTRKPDLSVHDINGIMRAYEHPLGTDDAGDHFASSMISGDFDGDGFTDLAVGAPDDGSHGAVYLFKGVSSSTEGTLDRLVAWRRLTPPGVNLSNFGASLATGDFDGDGITDLAVGAPGTTSGAQVLGGGLFVFGAVAITHPDGTASRTDAIAQKQAWTETSLGIALDNTDRFGAALAAGDFDGDGVDDLAVGIPRRTVGGKTDAGAVQVLHGRANGTFTTGKLWTAGAVPTGVVTQGARFGASLTAADLDPDLVRGYADLAVGAPGTSATANGEVFLMRGGPGGLDLTTPIKIGAPAGDAGARFGDALAAGDFDGRVLDGKRVPYLVIGAPRGNGGSGELHVYARDAGAFAYTRAQTVVEPAAVFGASDHLGGVLAVHVVDSPIGNPALIAGVPDHAPGGLVLVYGAGRPLSSPQIVRGANVQAGDAFGSAITGGDFVGVAGEQDELVVGSSGANGGAGSLRLADVTFGTSVTWRATLDQTSASPE